MDWASVISLLTGVGLAAFGIYLSVKFYLETEQLERKMVEMLAKIETLAVSTQQVQNELIRSAWERWLAGSQWEAMGRPVVLEQAVGGDVTEEGAPEETVEEAPGEGAGSLESAVGCRVVPLTSTRRCSPSWSRMLYREPLWS